MLNELKFAQGAVSKKDALVQAMTHFSIFNREVVATNGVTTIGSPINCDLNIRPKAKEMVQAIARCEDTISLHMTPGGKLSIRSGGFSVRVECSTDEYPFPRPQGIAVAIDGQALLEALTALRPFVAPRGANHKWAQGVCLRGKSAYATNGHALAEHWLGCNIPHEFTIPHDAVTEILRVKAVPTHIQLDQHSVTFHYSEGRWIRTALVPERFADSSLILNHKPQKKMPLPEGIFKCVRDLKPFVGIDNSIYMDRGNIRTHLDTNEGAILQFDFADGLYRMNIDDFLLLEDNATSIELNSWETKKPIFFFGKVMRGAFSSRHPQF